MKLTRVLAWIGVATACIAVAIAEAPPITGVEAIGVTVSDLDRSVEFYTQVLHFQKEWETELSGAEVEHLKGVFGVRVRVARLRLGSEEIELSEYLAPQGRPLPQDSRSNDLWFQHMAIVVRDIDEAYSGCATSCATCFERPETLRRGMQAGGIQAFYFRDPDGHVLEIIHFPQARAILAGNGRIRAVSRNRSHCHRGSNTERVLRLSRPTRHARCGHGENYGDEQEHLNNVFGARLRITSLRLRRPGIELLEYLAPRTGRSRRRAPTICALGDGREQDDVNARGHISAVTKAHFQRSRKAAIERHSFSLIRTAT